MAHVSEIHVPGRVPSQPKIPPHSQPSPDPQEVEHDDEDGKDEIVALEALPRSPQVATQAPITHFTISSTTMPTPKLNLPPLRTLLTPFNLFVAFDATFIVVTGAILFMLLVKWIKPATKDELDYWIEVTSQALNAIFTLNALLVAPSRTLNLYRLACYSWICSKAQKYAAATADADKTASPVDAAGRAIAGRPRVEPADAVQYAERIEAVYAPMLLAARGSVSESGSTGSSGRSSKTLGGGGSGVASAPEDDVTSALSPSAASSSATAASPAAAAASAALAVVPLWKWWAIIILLNLNCHLQWPMAGAMWGWATDYKNRPGWMVYTFLVLSFLAGGFGSVWMGLVAGKINKARKRLAAEDDEEEDKGARGAAVEAV
ncbi:hypothetical protein DFJ73DRAFT_956073 [Zopfochytrium polystomum]|nr:hypothetical protein DFJ73DRAFT_956073 [Zopfochytrium polystomum]